jgi:uncharacterized membrane protein HdeD (DUF308 family)
MAHASVAVIGIALALLLLPEPPLWVVWLMLGIAAWIVGHMLLARSIQRQRRPQSR